MKRRTLATDTPPPGWPPSRSPRLWSASRCVSTAFQSFLEVIDDVLCLYDLAVIFAHQSPVRSNQNHVDQVANRTVRLDFPAQLKSLQRLIDVPWTTGQKIPSLLIRPLLTRVVEQLFGSVMLGIDGDRNQRHLRTEIVAQPQRDVGKFCRLHQARSRARRVDEIHQHRLALERAEFDRVAILIDQLGIGENARGGRAALGLAMASSGREQANCCYYNDSQRSEITISIHYKLYY